MKKREQSHDSTAPSKRKRRDVRFEFEFDGNGEERIANRLYEMKKRVVSRMSEGEKVSEKVEDEGEVNDREET